MTERQNVNFQILEELRRYFERYPHERFGQGLRNIGVVAEGIIFDSGMCAMTWLSDIPTVTNFRNIVDVGRLHGHDGKTQVIVEGRKRHERLFAQCKEMARVKKKARREKEGS